MSRALAAFQCCWVVSPLTSERSLPITTWKENYHSWYWTYKVPSVKLTTHIANQYYSSHIGRILHSWEGALYFDYKLTAILSVSINLEYVCARIISAAWNFISHKRLSWKWVWIPGWPWELSGEKNGRERKKWERESSCLTVHSDALLRDLRADRANPLIVRWKEEEGKEISPSH